jgi:uncharacterized coiled-coil protein SlyX
MSSAFGGSEGLRPGEAQVFTEPPAELDGSGVIESSEAQLDVSGSSQSGRKKGRKKRRSKTSSKEEPAALVLTATAPEDEYTAVINGVFEEQQGQEGDATVLLPSEPAEQQFYAQEAPQEYYAHEIAYEYAGEGQQQAPLALGWQGKTWEEEAEREQRASVQEVQAQAWGEGGHHGAEEQDEEAVQHKDSHGEEFVMRQTGEGSLEPGEKEQWDVAVLPGADEWQEHVDKHTGQVYYFNPVTTESRWEKPKGGEAQGTDTAWQEVYDPITGQLYFFDPSTQESRWAVGAEEAAPSYSYAEAHNPYEAAVAGQEGAMSPYVDQPLVLSHEIAAGIETMADLRRQAGEEVEELQRAVAQQNELVERLEQRLGELTPVSAMQNDALQDLEGAIVRLQDLARCLYTHTASCIECTHAFHDAQVL